MKYTIGTRGSALSLAQTNWVISELKKKSPQTEFEIVTIKTKGDTDARPLFTINQKGIFEKEISGKESYNRSLRISKQLTESCKYTMKT